MAIDRIKLATVALRRVLRGTEPEMNAGSYGGLQIEPIMPTYAELARHGRIHVAGTGAGTAISPVAAMPTTTAQWALYNGHATRYLMPLQVACYAVSGTLGLGLSLLLGMSTAAQAAAVSAYASSTESVLFPGATAGSGVLGQNVTLAGAPSWFPIANRDQVAAVSVGAGLSSGDLQGTYLIPPTYALGINVFGADGTNDLFGISIMWAEIDLESGL